jgi:hypothetical protein
MHTPCFRRLFQLPLSGSPDDYTRRGWATNCALSTPSLGITGHFISRAEAIRYFVQTFNSLSRDHFRHQDAKGDEGHTPAFNSLSRDNENEALDLVHVLQRPFNSLSRDHVPAHYKIYLEGVRNFQLPLSGSRKVWEEGGGRRKSLSTPSLGITVGSFAEWVWEGITFNSLSRDHEAALMRALIAYLPFNSLSRDHGSPSQGGMVAGQRG